MLDDFKQTQLIAYKMITNSITKNKISHAYLIETNGYPKKMDFAIAFAKYLLCPKHYKNYEKCQDCTLCHRIDTNNFTELKIIEPDGLWIKKEQLEQLQQEFSKKSIESEQKIYIINGAEKLNLAAANSILKFLEEPEPNIIAILLTDNIYQLLDTIISRCQIISLKKVMLTEYVENDNIKKDFVFKIASKEATTEEELQNMLLDEQYRIQIEKAIQFVNLYEKSKKELIVDTNQIWHNIFKEKTQIIFGLDNMILYYKDILNMKLNRKIEIFDEYFEEIRVFSEKMTISEICNKIQVLIQAKENVKYNANNNLLIDKMILDLEEIENGKCSQS